MIMDKNVCIAILVLYGVVMLMMCYIVIFKTGEELKNRVHFYVVRDKSGVLNLYLGKPYRNSCIVSDFLADGIRLLACGSALKWYGLNQDDFKDLKWKDGPLEVFINMED